MTKWKFFKESFKRKIISLHHPKFTKKKSLQMMIQTLAIQALEVLLIDSLQTNFVFKIKTLTAKFVQHYKGFYSGRLVLMVIKNKRKFSQFRYGIPKMFFSLNGGS